MRDNWIPYFHLELPQEVRVGGQVPLHLHEPGQPSGPAAVSEAEAAAITIEVGGFIDVITAAVTVRVLRDDIHNWWSFCFKVDKTREQRMFFLSIIFMGKFFLSSKIIL